MTNLNNINSPISRDERNKLNENWQLLTQRFSHFQRHLNLLAGEDVEGVITNINERIAETDAALQQIETDLIEVNGAADNANTKAELAQTAADIAEQIAAIAQEKIDFIEEREEDIEFFTSMQNNLQAQVNQLVVSGDSSPEAAQARVDVDDITHSTLKSRIDNDVVKINQKIDSEIGQVTTQLAQTTANADNNNFIGDIDINNAYAVNAKAPLDIPTYVTKNNEVVHPSVLYFPNKWNGYHYWMGYTPFTDADNQWENPALVASQDGVKWELPLGVPDPVFPRPNQLAEGGFNADIVLVLDPDMQTLHMIWKWAGEHPTKNRILYASSSKDGKTWTPKQEILATHSSDRVDASPKILHDGKQYVMWTVDVAKTPNELIMMTSNSIYGIWSAPTKCNLEFPSGRELWHMDICRIGSLYIMIAQEGQLNADGLNAQLKLAKSYDGLNWTLADEPILPRIAGRWDASYYKSCIIPIIKDGVLGLRMWYGTATYFQFGVTDITFDKMERAEKLKLKRDNDILRAVQLYDNYLFADTFNRQNGVANLASSGNSWQNIAGTGLYVENKRATVNTEGNTVSVFNANTPDVEVSMDVYFSTLSTNVLVARLSTTNPNAAITSIRFGIIDGVYKVQRSNGVYSLFHSEGLGTPKNGDNLTLKVVGNNYECYINGVLMLSFTDDHNATSTLFGVQMGAKTASIDNFVIKSLNPSVTATPTNNVNQYLTDAKKFSTVTITTAQSIATNTPTAPTLTNIVHANGADFAILDSGKIRFTKSGVYEVDVVFAFTESASSTGYRQLFADGIYDTKPCIAADSSATSLSVRVVTQKLSTEALEFQLMHTNSAALNINTNRTKIIIRKVADI